MIFSRQNHFEQAFGDYYSRLVAFANKQLNDLAASEDLVQDLFIYLYENRERIEVQGSIKSYLFKATFNKCKSFQRKAITQERYLAELRKEDFHEYRDVLAATEFEKFVYDQIKKLPSRCQEVFILSRFEDKKNAEIADLLGISKRTVETQISKALKILRGKIEPKQFYSLFF